MRVHICIAYASTIYYMYLFPAVFLAIATHDYVVNILCTPGTQQIFKELYTWYASCMKVLRRLPFPAPVSGPSPSPSLSLSPECRPGAKASENKRRM